MMMTSRCYAVIRSPDSRVTHPPSPCPLVGLCGDPGPLSARGHGLHPFCASALPANLFSVPLVHSVLCENAAPAPRRGVETPPLRPPPRGRGQHPAAREQLGPGECTSSVGTIFSTALAPDLLDWPHLKFSIT